MSRSDFLSAVSVLDALRRGDSVDLSYPVSFDEDFNDCQELQDRFLSSGYTFEVGVYRRKLDDVCFFAYNLKCITE